MRLNANARKFGLIIVVGSILLLHVILRAMDGGNDINVYLFASKQLFNHQNIYSDNPYNNFLYSPFFALIIRPIAILNFTIARILWAILNLFLAIRIGKIIKILIAENFNLDTRFWTWWTVSVVFLSFGLLNDNIILGQITIVILWLLFESLYQIIYRNKNLSGALLLAIGISIKIIPILGLFYLFIKKKFRALVFCFCFIPSILWLPSLFIGHQYNFKMLQNWAQIINPSNSKYVFENDDGTHSLNGMLPAFFYNFNDGKTPEVNLNRQIIEVEYDTLVFAMQSIRVLLIISCVLLFLNREKRKENKAIYFYWEFAYLALVSTLIFPHQPYYAMLFFIPSASYMLLFILLCLRLKWALSNKLKTIAILASIILFTVAALGRDTLGDKIMNVLNFYHFLSFVNLVFLFFLYLIKPSDLLVLESRYNTKLSEKIT